MRWANCSAKYNIVLKLNWENVMVLNPTISSVIMHELYHRIQLDSLQFWEEE
ncbi:YgjP-like metallopeptidase domain-containing protein [Amphritea opalescens]|uniref:YgjP-like metallopeptidase domain-containing protein n=1 Tax=Amphritea opalescens TaxID=2490544 RepID=UPI003B973E0E